MVRVRAILLALILIVPAGVQAEWVMFGKDANHSGVAELTERTIQKREPTVSWDRGSSSEEVYSWGTSIGNFTPNIGGDAYDRNVLHIVYVTAEQDGDWLRGYLVIRDGGSPGKLMWKRDLGNIKNQNNQSLETEFESFEAAYGTPAIADFDGDGLLDIAVATPHGVIDFFEPEIEYSSSSESYDGGNDGDRWLHETGITIVRSNPAITSFNGGNDLVISGINEDEENEVAVVAVDGSTGDELWKFEADGNEISSPAVFEDGSSRKIFVSVYDNTQLEVYAIQSGSGLSDWNPKTIGTILNPNDTGQHPMLPSIVISDITEDTGKEILVPQPPATDNGDAQLWLFTDEGDYADGWSSSYVLEGGGEIDATPAVGDIDGDGENEIVAVTWEDPSDLGNNEITHVWAVSHDATLEWETEYDTDSSGGLDNDEHAISSPILAVIYNDDGENNLDVFTCTTPDCYALDGNDGSDGGGAKDQLWSIRLSERDDENRIFNSPAASDVDGDGLLDFVVDGAVYSADLADMTLKRSDILITDSEGNPVNEVEESQELTLYPITIRNDGNHDALNVDIEVRLDSTTGILLHEETIDIQSNSIKNLEEFNWIAEGQGNHDIWVMCIVDENGNEEVRYDNNNMSKSILVRPQYGLDISVTDSSELVDVNETATFDIDVTNMGLRTDNYTVSVTVLNPEWDITFPSTISNVVTNTTESFTVTFVPGPNVTASIHQFTVTATSEGNSSRFDSVFVNIEVVQYYSIGLDIPLSEQRVFPGTTFSYPVRITNNGNGDDTFDLYSTNDWNSQIRIENSPSGSITLAAFRTIEAELRITAPSDSSVGDFKEILFTAISQGNTTISKSVSSNTTIGIMMAEDAVIDILPGSSASFAIEFQNPNDDTETLAITISSGAPEWEYTISPEDISLEPDEKGYSWINFTAPNTAIPGDSYNIVIDLNGNETLDQINVILEVKPIQGVRLWSNDDIYHKYANPDEAVYFDLRVVNYESENLDVDLSYDESLLPEWTVLYNNETTWSKMVPGDTTTTVTIGVTAPNNAVAVETVWLRLLASVSGFEDNYFDANITVNQEFDLSVGCFCDIQLLGNTTELAGISVFNKGNGPDIFEVSYSGEWIENSTEMYSFDSFEIKQLSFPVNSGSAAPGTQSQVNVTVKSTTSILAGDEVSDSAILYFTVSGMRALESSSIVLNQGESGVYDIAIVSLIESDSPTSRVITEVSGDSYWWVNFDNTEEFDNKNTLIVPIGQPEIFSFTVEVPEDAPSGSYQFTLKVTDYNEPSHVSTLTYNLFVNQKFDIVLEKTSQPLSINPGENGEWGLRIINNGNGLDQISFGVVGLPDDWNYSFSDSMIEIPSGPPGENLASISLFLEVPNTALPTTYEFNVSAQSLGTIVNLTLNLTLNTIYQISATETSAIELTGQPGETVYFQFDVKNKGNSADTISVGGGGSMIDQALPTGFGWTSKTLQPNEIQSNFLKATIPNGEGPWTALITVSSSDSSASAETLTFTLNGQVLPDVSVRDLLFSPSSPKEGDKITARFTITAVDAPVESVYYSVYVDGRIVDGGLAYSIENGGSKLVSVAFTASSGCQEVKIEIDPESNLVESNTANNEVVNSICAEESSSSNLPLFIALFAVLIVAGAVYYRYSMNDKGSPAVVTKTAPVVTETPVNFPLILNCTQCGSRVRVARPGSFRCPSCKSVSSVDSNGKIKAAESELEKEAPVAVPPSKQVSSTSQRLRMEQFLSNEKEEEIEESPKPKSNLSASERLKQLKGEEELVTSEKVEDMEEEDEEPVKKEKKSKKRRGPPKGGSFGPTVGGF